MSLPLAAACAQGSIAAPNNPSPFDINNWLKSPWGQAPGWTGHQQSIQSIQNIQGRPTGAQSPFPAFTPLDVLRIMFGGGGSGNGNGSSSAGEARNQEAYSNASACLQTALDQTSQAEDAASRAGSIVDQDARQAAASEAQDHANAARAAAAAAASAAYGASQAAADQAAQARDAANRAQCAADRAAASAGGAQW